MTIVRYALMLVAVAAVLGACSRTTPIAPEVPPAYVGTWHLAGQADLTTLTFGEDTFTYVVGDGTTLLQPLVTPDGGMEAPENEAENVATMLTVRGSLAVEDNTSFTLTVPDDGVAVGFVERVAELTQELATAVLTVLFQELTEESMTVEIDETGTTMTITGLFGGILNQENPLAPLTACKDAPCADA
ncbi:MAG: hypothetical protein OXC31_11820 [Spirochaetaceae bacterium]|nr:hypothetical protein [Spirochaetaceae bacterium]